MYIIYDLHRAFICIRSCSTIKRPVYGALTCYDLSKIGSFQLKRHRFIMFIVRVCAAGSSGHLPPSLPTCPRRARGGSIPLCVNKHLPRAPRCPSPRGWYNSRYKCTVRTDFHNQFIWGAAGETLPSKQHSDKTAAHSVTDTTTLCNHMAIWSKSDRE